MRPLVVILLLVCMAPLTGSAARSRQPAPADTFFHQATALIAHGRAADAAQLATARGATDPDAAAILGELAIRQGRLKEAETILRPVVTAHPASAAGLQLALLYRGTGRLGDSEPLLATILRDGSESADADALVRAARAAQALGRARDANALFRQAERAGANPAVVETYWGRLFLQTYNQPEALKSFKAALTADPKWAPAHAGLARVLAEDDPAAGAKAAAAAIAIDPDLADAHLLLAELHLDADRDAEARAEIDTVLAANPSQLDARALLAAIAYVHDDRAAYDQEVSRILDINPAFGEVYRVAGQLAASHYRFEDAAALAAKAVQLDPSDSRASGDLGMHLMRTGDEDGARRALDRAFREDPFNVVTYNLLSLLDTLDTFVTIREGEFVFRMQKEEAPVLREYAIPLAQKAIKDLSARYQFTPTGPILIEIFPQHDDFAVRNLGLPGMIGALGACFGRVVTMDSPKARPPGTFAWQATLWHELAHVITLQMSKQRVPRWLTEGISVYEEGRARPEWGRDMEVTFARAMDKGEVLKLKDLNAGFTRPDTIALAYYEASLLVDHIVRTKGDAALRALVSSFGSGIETDAAIERTLQVSMDDLQASFDQALEQRFGAVRRALHDTPSLGEGSETGLRALAAARPDSYVAQLAYGKLLADAGDPAAFAPLDRAAALVPSAVGPESPHALMASLAEKLSDKPRAMRELEKLMAVDHTNVDAARKLGALATEAKDDRLAALAFQRVASLDPFDAAAHSGWGRLALKQRDTATAMREFRAALATGPSDKAAAYCDLGESYLQAGKPAEAKQQALAALEIAPTYPRAQELLLNAIGGHP